MITYSSILAWKIPGTEEPGGLQSMEFKKSWTQLNDQVCTREGPRGQTHGGGDGCGDEG